MGGGGRRAEVRDQRAELRPLQNLRHQGSEPEHYLGAAGRRRRAELSEYVNCHSRRRAAAFRNPYFVASPSQCPASCRASTSYRRFNKTWMAGTTYFIVAAEYRFRVRAFSAPQMTRGFTRSPPRATAASRAAAKGSH